MLKSWAFWVDAPSPLACLPLFHPFFLAPTVYFQAPATEARKLKSSIEDVIDFFNAVIPIHNFVQSRNSEGYFWQKHLPYPKTKENKI